MKASTASSTGPLTTRWSGTTAPQEPPGATKKQYNKVKRSEPIEKEKIEIELDSDVIEAIGCMGDGMTTAQFVEYAISQTLSQAVDKREDDDFGWYLGASRAAQSIMDKAGKFEELFADMRFKPDTITHEFIECTVQGDDGSCNEWELDIPEELECLSHTWFTFSVEELPGGTAGRFNPATQTLTIDTASVDDDSVLLHELIHLHEFVLDSLPMYFHDVYLWCSYCDLRKKIPDLDERIMEHGCILNEYTLTKCGGVHDLLFLLKSFDLDLRMNYPLGTVFGYGMAQGTDQNGPGGAINE